MQTTQERETIYKYEHKTNEWTGASSVSSISIEFEHHRIVTGNHGNETIRCPPGGGKRKWVSPPVCVLFVIVGQLTDYFVRGGQRDGGGLGEKREREDNIKRHLVRIIHI